MIRLTKVQTEYIAENIKNFLTCEELDHGDINTMRALKRKNILIETPGGYYYSSNYEFTKSFIDLLKLNCVNIYGSNRTMFLMLDPVFIDALNCMMELNIAYTKYKLNKINGYEYNFFNDKFMSVRKNARCISDLAFEALDNEKIHIPTRLKEHKTQ